MTDRRDNDEKWESRSDKAYSDFTNKPYKTGFKWFFIICAVFLGLWLIGSIFGFIGSWGNEGKRIVSPTNVREQHTAIIEDYEAMEAAAENACSGTNSKKDEDDPSLVEKPDFAYAALYRKIRVEYNRRQKNLFEAKLVGPKGYPRSAPTLEEMKATVC